MKLHSAQQNASLKSSELFRNPSLPLIGIYNFYKSRRIRFTIYNQIDAEAGAGNMGLEANKHNY